MNLRQPIVPAQLIASVRSAGEVQARRPADPEATARLIYMDLYRGAYNPLTGDYVAPPRKRPEGR